MIVQHFTFPPIKISCFCMLAGIEIRCQKFNTINGTTNQRPKLRQLDMINTKCQQPSPLPSQSKSLTNLEELSFLMVLAFPNASRMGLA